GAIATRSGWMARRARLHVVQTPQLSPSLRSHRSARPTARARVLFPTPSGPVSRTAGGTRSWTTALPSSVRTRSCPRTLANGTAHRRDAAPLEDREQPLEHVVGAGLAVDRDPALRLLAHQLEISRADPLVEG